MKKRYYQIASFLLLTVIFLICILIPTRKASSRPITANFIKWQMMFSTMPFCVKNNRGQIRCCSSFVYDKDGYDYKLATAGHCFLLGDRQNSDVFSKLSIIVGKAGYDDDRAPIRKAEYIGGVKDGYVVDFAVLKMKAEEYIPVLRLSHSDPYLGQCVFVVGFPAESDDNIIFTYVRSLSHTDKTVLFDLEGISNSEAISGSPLFSCENREVVGIVVGGIKKGGNGLFAIPVSRFRKFIEDDKKMMISRPDGC